MQHKSVRLPNGDDVGVVVPWHAPGVLDNITSEQVEQVRELAKGGNYRVDSQSTEWIGNAVADVLGFDIENETDRSVIKSILKKWFDGGVLKKVHRPDKHRHLKMVVEAGSKKMPKQSAETKPDPAPEPVKQDAEPTLTCAGCGAPFESKRKDTQFCSSKCRVKAHRKG